jgi:rhodanese-related sulfurtransferase
MEESIGSNRSRTMKMLSNEEFKHFRESGEQFTLLNVLPAGDFEKTKIPGAVSVPVDEPDFVDRVSKMIGKKEEPVVTYCANEQCPASTQAAEKLEKAGFTDVYDFKGGFEAWSHAEKTEPSKKPAHEKTHASGTR